MALGPAPTDFNLQLMVAEMKSSEGLVSVITHWFLARDLYKLFPPDTFEEDTRDAFLYNTPSSVLLPLRVYYFAILGEYMGGFSYYIRKGCLAYRKHLQYLIDEYEWPTVFEYHCAYFDRRQVLRIRSEPRLHPMGWLTPDYQLMDQFDLTPEDASTHSGISLPTEMDMYTENDIQPITVMLRSTDDPFADDGIQYLNYAKHKIYQWFSWLDLPHPFEDTILGWTIFHGDHLFVDTDGWSEFPVKDVINLLSHEGGKYPFLTLITEDHFYSSKAMVSDRRRDEDAARCEEESLRNFHAEVQRRAKRRAYFRGLLPRAPSIFKPQSAKPSPPSSCDSTDKTELSDCEYK